MLTDLFSGEGSLTGLQMATFLLCPHVVLERVQREEEGKSALWCLFFGGH